MDKSKKHRRGCLALLFGIGSSGSPKQTPKGNSPDYKLEDSHEGNVHSGPGGYEGMGYSGGYAADYFSDEGEWREH